MHCVFSVSYLIRCQMLYNLARNVEGNEELMTSQNLSPFTRTRVRIVVSSPVPVDETALVRTVELQSSRDLSDVRVVSKAESVQMV
jgi:hypothetical protein